jgi:hypothetical protein
MVVCSKNQSTTKKFFCQNIEFRIVKADRILPSYHCALNTSVTARTEMFGRMRLMFEPKSQFSGLSCRWWLLVNFLLRQPLLPTDRHRPTTLC